MAPTRKNATQTKKIVPQINAEDQDKSWKLPSWTNNALLVGLILGAIAGWHELDKRIAVTEIDIGKIKQEIADGGSHAIVSELTKATTPQQVAANMNVLSGKIQLAKAKAERPNLKQIKILTPSILESAERYPTLPQTWSTIAELASYRTQEVKFSLDSQKNLPDCDAESATAEIIERSQIPDLPMPGNMVNTVGYLFQNCLLHLNHLPGHRLSTNVTAANGKKLISPQHVLIGHPAYAINCVIELDDSGISDTDIIWLQTRNCQFRFSSTNAPPLKEERFLVAALQTPEPGTGTLPINGS